MDTTKHTSESTSFKSSSAPTRTQAEIAKDITKLIDLYFNDRINTAGKLHPRYKDLLVGMRRLASSGGKRMRPYLCNLAYEAYGGSNFNAINYVAAAQEMIHFAMLIHDDVIDRDFSRHGVDNISGQFLKHYQSIKTNKQADINHYANSSAILAGDIALSSAYDLIGKSDFDANLKIRAQEQLSESIFTVVGGEFIDTDAIFYEFENTDPLLVARHKTSFYTYVAPMVTGAIMANAPEAEQIKLECFGIALGIAYQLTDDNLGIFGDIAKTGKSVLSDIREGKRTYLYKKALELASKDQRAILDKYYGKSDITQQQSLQVKSVLKNCGAYDACIRKIDELSRQALEVANQLAINTTYKAEITKVIDISINREA